MLPHRALATAALVLLGSASGMAGAGYRAHGGEKDLRAFLGVWGAARGGRLDSCTLCHPGGKLEGHGGGPARFVDSCTYCHETYGFQPRDGIVPLGPYGRDYLNAGRSAEAVRRLAFMDSDGDGATNWLEVLRGTFPGDPSDRPGLAWPPLRDRGLRTAVQGSKLEAR